MKYQDRNKSDKEIKIQEITKLLISNNQRNINLQNQKKDPLFFFSFFLV